MYDEPEPEKPEHCIEGYVDIWGDEFEDDGEIVHTWGEYFHCTKWEPGYPPIMTERSHVIARQSAR